MNIKEIEKLIKVKGLTWFEVAEKIGVDYITFHLWMKEPTQQRMDIIRNVLK